MFGRKEVDFVLVSMTINSDLLKTYKQAPLLVLDQENEITYGQLRRFLPNPKHEIIIYNTNEHELPYQIWTNKMDNL